MNNDIISKVSNLDIKAKIQDINIRANLPDLSDNLWEYAGKFA